MVLGVRCDSVNIQKILTLYMLSNSDVFCVDIKVFINISFLDRYINCINIREDEEWHFTVLKLLESL